jgi:hypothetical protein
MKREFFALLDALERCHARIGGAYLQPVVA